jgi:thiosulfate/3-mercaptopyruvate sulfurtransferase
VQSKRLCRVVFFFIFLIVVFGTTARCRAQFSDPSTSASSIPESERMQPAELAKMLQGDNAKRPLVLQVGSRVMFGQAHIPGSAYAGPGSQPAGLQLLESKVASAARSRLIIIYCGCCPWTRCPNIAPAYKRLRELGFTNVKALYLASNFGDDWVGKGFPAAQGQ